MKVTALKEVLKPLLKKAVEEAPKEFLGVLILEKEGPIYTAVKGIPRQE